jgi:undecaprenyl-diphosphatase
MVGKRSAFGKRLGVCKAFKQKNSSSFFRLFNALSHSDLIMELGVPAPRSAMLAITVRDYIASRDYRLMRRVNRWSAPQWVRAWMICATRGGDGWLWYILMAALLFAGGDQRFQAVGAMLTSGALTITGFLSLKRITNRKRPCMLEPHCWAKLLPPDQFSFPSGHTMTAFALAVVVSLFYPSLMAGVLFCAVSIAASRILLGMHFLSDVLAGSLLGASIGYFTYTLFR